MNKFILTIAAAPVLLLAPSFAMAELRAGATIVDATPMQFPVLVNGGMTSRSADGVKTPINVRALVLDDGSERIGIVVVDSCMIPRSLLDEAKALAAQQTQIRPDRILISATHSHTAPSCMGALGTDADPNYPAYLREKIVQALVEAESHLEPARVGWASANAPGFTALRRWIRRPDRVEVDPFGNRTVRANMHAGRNWDDVTGESGPEDPELSLIAFQAADGRPIAVLANFSMHYFGDQPLSADYFGLFCEAVEEQVMPNAAAGHPPLVAIMSHGCSGDIWRKDYTRSTPSPEENFTIDVYARRLAAIAIRAYQKIEYRAGADLAMSETRLRLKYRVPGAERLEWARRIVEAMGDRLPKDRPEIYAREQIMLHERQSTEVVVQGLRVGDIGIVTTPTETYALTGLKLKLQSPLNHTMVIELANGGDGYIPPPEQHLLGGYNTWPARSAGLEVWAEPKIVEAALLQLEKVAGRPRRVFCQSRGPGCLSLLRKQPAAYWRLDEFAGPCARDISGQGRDGIYEPEIAYFLAGPSSESFCNGGETNRATHFAGGRLRARLPRVKEQYSVSLWFWNGMPADGREVTGWMVSRGHDFGLGPHGDHLGIGGTAGHMGKLIFLHGEDLQTAVAGKSNIERWTWNHVLLVRDGRRVQVYLNHSAEPEIDITAPADFPPGFDQWFFGGRCDRDSNWEGRLDEIAVFDRALTPDEIATLNPTPVIAADLAGDYAKISSGE